jgi:hypothetical protein
MPIPTEFRPAIREVVRDLGRGDFARIEAAGRAGRVGLHGLRYAIASYGCRLVELPEAAFDLGDSYPNDLGESEWQADVPLWTAEEGRSDLTLQLTIRRTAAGVELEIDDLHVL